MIEKLENIDLHKYNTMRLHSIAKVMYIPNSKEDLFNLIKEFSLSGEEYYILSGGSNIVFSEYVTTPIINLMKLDNTICIAENKIVECGCSVRVQHLINTMKKNNLGGIEYLFSLPTSIGGAVYMNAGRGRKWRKSISDYVLEVEYLDIDNLEYKTISVEKAEFSYRNSIFQHKPWIIVKIKFNFLKQAAEETQKLIEERINQSNKNLDTRNPSCGSVFCKANPIITRLVKGIKIGGAKYSSKTPNWISNVDNATATDIKKLVQIVIIIHRIFLQKIKIEIHFYD